MKYILATLFTVSLVTAASAQSYRSPVGKQEPVRAVATPPPHISQRGDIEGAIPRGVRGGNPLQLLNPKAPAQYGTAMQSVVFEPYTWKWRGIKLFEILW
jgi:hypothetical protein